jgi:hypothetical protein
MIIIIRKFPCEIIILQIYDRNTYYIIEVPDIKGTQYYVQIFKKRILNIIIISSQSVNEWPVFNLK